VFQCRGDPLKLLEISGAFRRRVETSSKLGRYGILVDMNAKEAIRIAQAFLMDLEPPASSERLELDEIALSDDEKSWLVTFAVVSPARDEEGQFESGVNDSVRVLLGLGSTKAGRMRSIRTVKVRRDDGAFLALKNAS
jgi:hypothetical protein